jgi:hypothetical protein
MNDICEPPFETAEESFLEPIWGPYQHTDNELRLMWSLLWVQFKSRKMCREFMHYNRLCTIPEWREALSIAASQNPDFSSLRYVVRIAQNRRWEARR